MSLVRASARRQHVSFARIAALVTVGISICGMIATRMFISETALAGIANACSLALLVTGLECRELARKRIVLPAATLREC